MPKKVTPASASGWNMSLAQIFGLGPKWVITCGVCGRTWKERLPMVDNPGLECPSCKTINVIPVEVKRDE